MTHCYNTLCTLIVGATLVFVCGLPFLAAARGVDSLPDGPVACSAFQ